MIFPRIYVNKVCSWRAVIPPYIKGEVNYPGFTRMLFTSSIRRSRGRWSDSKHKGFEPMKGVHNNINVDTGQVEFSRLFKPLVFTACFSATSFTIAAIWQYENIRHRTMSAFYKGIPWFQGRIKQSRHGEWKNNLVQFWNRLSEGQKMFVPICLANILVFLAWRVPYFQTPLVKFFCSNPASKVLCWPMVLSTFSHYSAFHLFTNMYVLHSFSTGAVMSLGKEQFLGFYFAAGVISSFASYVYKVVVNRPGLSLGASGAIMAVLGYACSKYPDLELSIIFFPFFTFKAGAAIKFIMGLDLAGILLGWKIFDHAAHLGGALFGIFWADWGQQYIWSKRDPMIEAWHNIRKS